MSSIILTDKKPNWKNIEISISKMNLEEKIFIIEYFKTEFELVSNPEIANRIYKLLKLMGEYQ